MRRPDRHNEIELNFLTEGWVTYLFGSRLIRVEPNRLTVFWAAIPHQIVDHGGQADYFVVTIPLGWFLRLLLPDRFVQALLRGQMIVPNAQDSTSFEFARLSDWERDFETDDPKNCAATLLEIEAQFRRLSLRCPEVTDLQSTSQTSQSVVHETGYAKAEQMAHLVANRYHEQIDASTFAREINLQPKHAMKLFHQVFGTSLAAYLTEYRISQAQRFLVTTSMSIIDVSEAAGFGSLSRFNRAFRQMCGCSPREYRKSHAIKMGP